MTSRVSSLLLVSVAHMLDAIVQLESMPQSLQSDSTAENSVLSGMINLSVDVCERAVLSIEGAAAIFGARSTTNGDDASTHPFWLDVGALWSQLHGFMYMLQIHGLHVLCLRYVRALDLLGDFFSKAECGSMTSSRFKSEIISGASTKRTQARCVECQKSTQTFKGDCQSTKQSLFFFFLPRRHKRTLPFAQISAEAHLLTLNCSEMSDTERDRVKRLKAKFSTRRKEHCESKASENKKGVIMPEQLYASALWAESQCHDFTGRPIDSLRYALMSLIFKKLGHREGTLDASTQEQIDEATAKNMGLVQVNEQQRRLLPMIRMDQWVLLHDFFDSLRQLIRLFTARGLPHKSEYWILQALSWAKSLGSCYLVRNFTIDCQMLESWTGRNISHMQKTGDERLHNEKTIKDCPKESILLQMQRHRKIAEADARRHLCKSNLDKACLLYEHALTKTHVLRSCVDVSLNRDLYRGLAFARTQILMQGNQKSHRDHINTRNAACVAMGSMGLAYEMEHYTRRESFKRKQRQLCELPRKYEREALSSTIDGRDSIGTLNIQELENQIDQAAASLPQNLSVVSMSWDPEVGLNIARVQGISSEGDLPLLLYFDQRPIVPFCRYLICSTTSFFAALIPFPPQSMLPKLQAFKAEWWERRRQLDGDMRRCEVTTTRVSRLTAAFIVGSVCQSDNGKAQNKCLRI